jgi:hypothetical protein
MMILVLHEVPRNSMKVHEENYFYMEFDSLSKEIIGCAIEVH